MKKRESKSGLPAEALRRQRSGASVTSAQAGMNRRQALRRLAAGAGASAALPVVGRAVGREPQDQARHHSGAGQAPLRPTGYGGQALGSARPPDPALSAKDWKPNFFDAHENETVLAVADLLIPETDTPGAKAAQVNRFIDLMLSVESAERQKAYLQALGWLDGYCLKQYSNPFTKLGVAQQTDVLTLLTHENETPETAHGVKLFRIIKQSIVDAYYSSEVGLLQELKYETNPFQPEFPGCKNPEEH